MQYISNFKVFTMVYCTSQHYGFCIYCIDDSYPSNSSPIHSGKHITPNNGVKSLIRQPKRSIIGIRQQLKAYRNSIAVITSTSTSALSHTLDTHDASSATETTSNMNYKKNASSFVESANRSANVNKRTSDHDTTIPVAVAVTVPLQNIPVTPERTPEVQRLIDFYRSEDPTEHLFDNMWDDYLEE